MATAPTIARNLFVAVTDTHAEGGEGGTCEASSARMTSHARAVAPIPLSPLGGGILWAPPRPRRLIEPADWGRREVGGEGGGDGECGRNQPVKKPARGEATGPRRYNTRRTTYIVVPVPRGVPRPTSPLTI